MAGESDISNIDAEFTDEPVVDSYIDETHLSGKVDEFNNFTYVPKSALAGKKAPAGGEILEEEVM